MFAYAILDKNGEKVTSRFNKYGIYFSMRDLKEDLKRYVNIHNKKLKKSKTARSRSDLLHYEDYSVAKYELVRKD